MMSFGWYCENLAWGSVVKFFFQYFDTIKKKLTPARISLRYFL